MRAELTVRDQANVLLSQESTASSCGPLRALVHAVHHIRSSGQPTQKWGLHQRPRPAARLASAVVTDVEEGHMPVTTPPPTAPGKTRARSVGAGVLVAVAVLSGVIALSVNAPWPVATDAGDGRVHRPRPAWFCQPDLAPG